MPRNARNLPGPPRAGGRKSCWEWTAELRSQAQEKGATFKRLIATRRGSTLSPAFQDGRGRQLHEAVINRILDPDHEMAKKFLGWFCRLFRVDAGIVRRMTIPESSRGLLSIVATPIGNLEDLAAGAAGARGGGQGGLRRYPHQRASCCTGWGSRKSFSLHEHNEGNACRRCSSGWRRAKRWR